MSRLGILVESLFFVLLELSTAGVVWNASRVYQSHRRSHLVAMGCGGRIRAGVSGIPGTRTPSPLYSIVFNRARAVFLLGAMTDPDRIAIGCLY